MGTNLQFEHGSFLERHSPWTLGDSPRIIYVNGPAMGNIWTKLETAMRTAEWVGSSSVVIAILGRKTAIFKPLGRLKAPVSWMPSVNVNLYSAHLQSLPIRIFLQQLYKVRQFSY